MYYFQLEEMKADNMHEYEVTLEEMLKAREDRVEKQRKLIAEYGLPLISFTVNMPGARKNTPLGSRIFLEGLYELEKRLESSGFTVVYQNTCDLLTGPEAYVVVDIDEYALKELTLQIENRHSLGRLWDFDVIGRDGQAVSREALGYQGRRCLLCGEDAHACARSRAHSIDELLKKIQLMADVHFQNKRMA